MSQTEEREPSTPTASGTRNPLRRVRRFLREVFAELRKVVFPTREMLVTYTLVVLVFVTVVMAYVSALDFGFGQLVLFVFGGADA